MCGRAAYSTTSLSSAASSLKCVNNLTPTTLTAKEVTSYSNPNISPGNSVHVFRYDQQLNSVHGIPMIWGLLPNNGSAQSPHLLPSDDNFSPSLHYKMFNARSETLDTKKSFHGLLRDKQSCIFAVDGYYEWKDSLSPIDKRKQPYFVKSSSHKPLLLAGLWNEVKTGRSNCNNEEETILTFTTLTTEAHSKYAWLHPRQPCILEDSAVAREWLQNPSKALVNKVRSLNNGQQQQGDTKCTDTDPWECFPVTKKMNDSRYQGEDCTMEFKSKSRKLDSYFASPNKRKKGDTSNSKLEMDLKKKDVIEMAPKADDANGDSPIDIIGKEWSCGVCTYIHTKSKSRFLACEMCGSERKSADDTEY